MRPVYPGGADFLLIGTKRTDYPLITCCVFDPVQYCKPLSMLMGAGSCVQASFKFKKVRFSLPHDSGFPACDDHKSRDVVFYQGQRPHAGAFCDYNAGQNNAAGTHNYVPADDNGCALHFAELVGNGGASEGVSMKVVT